MQRQLALFTRQTCSFGMHLEQRLRNLKMAVTTSKMQRQLVLAGSQGCRLGRHLEKPQYHVGSTLACRKARASCERMRTNSRPQARRTLHMIVYILTRRIMECNFALFIGTTGRVRVLSTQWLSKRVRNTEDTVTSQMVWRVQ